MLFILTKLFKATLEESILCVKIIMIIDLAVTKAKCLLELQ